MEITAGVQRRHVVIIDFEKQVTSLPRNVLKTSMDTVLVRTIHQLKATSHYATLAWSTRALLTQKRRAFGHC
jgi:predicted Ser/Thr protein kinase